MGWRKLTYVRIFLRNNTIDSSEHSDIFEYRRSEMKKSRQKLTSLNAMGQAADCLRVLAHPHRLRMIQMLLSGDFTVGELAEACELPTAMASEHLRLMQRCGFLSSEKEGRKVFYRVIEPHLQSILKCIEDRFDHALVK
jgi:ArsR family transcriptional regulator, zinc-responsive transcriptional repressor